MKTIVKSSIIATLLCLVLVMGCGKEAPPPAASGPTLQEAFEKASPALKQGAETVANHIQAKHYAEATKALEPLAMNPNLTEPQVQAVLIAISQIGNAIASDPKLDTPEMATLRARMFSALRRGTR